MKIVIIGLSITSSWGNGHATTYRSLVSGLAQTGQDVVFLERDQPWYAEHRDLPRPGYCTVALYGPGGLAAHRDAIAAADLVIVGSYVDDGAAACRFVQRTATGRTAFYDIDTPVTLAALAAGTCGYLDPGLIAGFDLYLSFTGGPMLRRIERDYGARAARALYCSADPVHNAPDPAAVVQTDLGYLGTYGADRQPTLETLLIEPARQWPQGRFGVTGPQYPAEIAWPDNVARGEHAPPHLHRAFYTSQRWTLNVTRADMVRAGWSPSVRLFEAALCGTPIISDWWEGIEGFFVPDEEIVIARRTGDVLAALREMPETRRAEIAAAARVRVLSAHTGRHRAGELLAMVGGA